MIKKGKFFCYKKKGHTTSDFLKKGKIAAISEDVRKASNS